MTQQSIFSVNPADGFRLPRYNELPAVGLYLDQTVKYIARYLDPLQQGCLSGSMISNYVKKRLIENPRRKQYSRDQIAYLIFIALAKNVISLDNLRDFIGLQQKTYPIERAYNYFCDEFENVLQYVFGLKQDLDDVGQDSTREKFILRNAIIAICHTLFLEKYFDAMADDLQN